MSAKDFEKLDRSQIRAMLAELASSPPPESSPGAMCYSVRAARPRTDYVCPSCGERTQYSEDDARTARFLNSGLESCRHHFKGIAELVGDAVTLDESQFCRSCSPDVDAPKLVLMIDYVDGEPKVIAGVSPVDLQMICEFLSGDRTHSGPRGSTMPLKDQLPRLQKLLGVRIEGGEPE